ncbi:MAG: TIR domain-containing protein [Candidatus Hermodarchaeota archaeon]
MSESYDDIFKRLLSAIPEVKEVVCLDRNANLVASATPAYRNVDSIVMSTSVAYLSVIKLVLLLDLGDIEHFNIRGEDGWIFGFNADENRLLIVRTTKDVRFGLIMLDIKRTVEKLRKIPYSMPERKVSLERRLEEIEDEFRENYKLFFSYAKADSSKFKIKELADYVDNNFPNVQVMYFEKSKLAGEDILDYMERGVNWCNFFVWVHSPESMKSEAVKKEYKMAVYLGKKIISITNDFNSLPLSARVTWAILFNENIEELGAQLMDDISNYDIKTSTKQEF